jgi:3-phosphoshikimate 1-carboxyvinyltransferase
MGAEVTIHDVREEAGDSVGDVLVRGAELTATVIEGKEVPSLIDEIPVLAVAACFARGTTVIRDAHELRVKETDRIGAMAMGLTSLGARVEETRDGLVIEGGQALKPGRVRTFSDHRIAMSFFILSRIADIEVDLDEAGCVDISFPGFFELMGSLA